MHRQFRIGPAQVSLNLLPPEFNRREILLTIAIMKEKQQEILLGVPKKCPFLSQLDWRNYIFLGHLVYEIECG